MTQPSGAPRRRSRLLLVTMPVLAVFAAFGLIVWLAYVSGAPGSAVGEPPLIKADAGPLKLSPDDPGERAVADQGGVGELFRDQPEALPERLLPLPEEPRTPAAGEFAETAPEVPPGTAATPLPAADPEVTIAPAGPGQETARGTGAGDRETATATAQDTSPQAAGEGRGPVKPGTEAVAALDSLFDEVTRAEGEAGAPEQPVPPAGEVAPGARPEPTAAGATARPGVEAKLADVRAVLAEAKQDAVAQGDAGQPAAGEAGRVADGAATAGAEVAAVQPDAVAGGAGQDGGDARPEGARLLQPPPPRPTPTRAAAADPAPSRTTAASPAVTRTVPAGPAPASAAVSAEGRYRIQLAAVREEADARRAWDLFQVDLGELLAGAEPIIERAETENGTFFRLQIGPYAELARAESVCEELKDRNASCFVIRR